MNNSMSINSPSLPVMESFLTIQGEGAHTGSAAYFIRLGGCDVGCVWCDVKDSWDASQHEHFTVETLTEQAVDAGVPIVVITGGEPLMYDLSELTRSLKAKGLRTHVETSGVYPVTGQWDWICFSPKKFKEPHAAIYSQAHELKVIVYHKSDLAWAEQHASSVNEQCTLLLQPEWSKADEMSPLIVEYVKKNPKWRISLQTHKFLKIP